MRRSLACTVIYTGVCAVLQSAMSASLEELLGKMREAALVKGEDWLRETVAKMLGDKGAADAENAQPHAKRSRPQERRSPSPVHRTRRRVRSQSPVPRSQHRVRSPDRDPPGAAAGCLPTSEVPCPRRNPFSLESTLQTAINEPHDEDLRTALDNTSQSDTDSGPTSAVTVTVTTSDDEPGDDHGGEDCSSPITDSQPDKELMPQLCNNSGNGKVPVTAHSRVTAEESDAVRIERLLQSCSAAVNVDRQHAPPLPMPVSRSAPDLQPCVVWILGNSFVTSALESVSLKPDGCQLGFPRSKATIRWLGSNRLTWDTVRSTATRYSQLYRPPDILVVHAGENDLGSIPIRYLIEYVKFDMLRLKGLFPGVVLVWSEIVNRCKWLQAMNQKGLDRARIKVNKAASKYLADNGVVVVRHKSLEGDTAHLFEEDGVQLNSAGNDIWCIDLQEGIDKALQIWQQSHGKHTL